MKKTTTIYTIFLCISMVFIFWMINFEQVETQETRNNNEVETLTEYEFDVQKNEYTLQLNVNEDKHDYLAFYLVHQYAKVYIDQTLVYELRPSEKNKIGRTPASNWVMIPIYPEDDGATVVIEVIPVYEAVQNRKITIFQGEKYDIYSQQIQRDFPQIIISITAILETEDEKEVNILLDKIRKNTEVSFSVGVASSVDYPTESLRQLFQRADEAMYKNKRENK